jgi:hypothetical protein
MCSACNENGSAMLCMNIVDSALLELSFKLAILSDHITESTTQFTPSNCRNETLTQRISTPGASYLRWPSFSSSCLPQISSASGRISSEQDPGADSSHPSSSRLTSSCDCGCALGAHSLPVHNNHQPQSPSGCRRHLREIYYGEGGEVGS